LTLQQLFRVLHFNPAEIALTAFKEYTKKTNKWLVTPSFGMKWPYGQLLAQCHLNTGSYMVQYESISYHAGKLSERSEWKYC
jgi:hypothetical protein